MATTKIWAIKDSLSRVVDYAQNPEKTEYKSLRKTLHYIRNEEKTTDEAEKKLFVTGVNCSSNNAYNEMIAVQKHFGKTDKNVAYHAYQSFKTGEVTAFQCHQIGVELARKMWGDEYQVLVATHLNTGTLHNHFVVNSVSPWTGKKFNCNEGAYYKFRSLSDELCRQHNLTVIEKPRGRTPRSIYMAEKMGEPTRYNLMREAIDKAISMSIRSNDFFHNMQALGYIVDMNPYHKYATIRSVNGKKNTRLYQLGEGYDRDDIYDRIQKNRERGWGDIYLKQRDFNNEQKRFIVPKRMKLKGSFSTARRISGFKVLILYYMYLLGKLPTEKHHRPLSPECREASRRIDEYSRMVRLIHKCELYSTADVKDYITAVQKEMDKTVEARSKIYNKLRRCSNEEKIRELKAERDGCTTHLKGLRRDLKTANAILETIPKVRQDIAAERNMYPPMIARSRPRYREWDYER